MRLHRVCVSLTRTRSACVVREFSVTAGRRNVDEYPDGWETARPFEEIPGPSKLNLVRMFLPGGELHNRDALSIQHYLHNKYGSLARLPSILGKQTTLYAFDPHNFETVFRTEGAWPLRRNLETFAYYRKHLRPGVFKGIGGLVNEQGETWLKVRQAVNPAMMSTKTFKSYIPSVDEVASEFVHRIGELRDASGEMPPDFMNELGLWALESIGLIALDRRLNVMRSERSDEADRLIGAVRNFYRLSFELEMQPSLWRYCSTRNYRNLMASFDLMTDYITKYIDEATADFDKNQSNERSVSEMSVLQKLLLKDRHYAFLMTFDMIFAGIDTTSSAMATLLHRLAVNPEQQEKLREEVFRLMPTNESTVTKENYDDFAYFRACLKESMRMQPQVAGNLRATGKNIILNGYRVPKETDVFMAHNLLQMSDEYFPNSQQFLPERWLRNDANFEKNRNPFVYLPFGFGARSCIGKRFGELELQILTARLLRKYRVEWHHGPLKFVNAMVITPSDQMKFRMVPL